MCTYKLHRWNVPQNNVWKNGMCPFLTSLMPNFVINYKTLHECALLESNVVVLSWWTNETKMSPNKKDITCLILKMWEMHAKHYLYQNEVYNSFMFVNLSILISFSLSFVGSFAPFGRTCFELCSLCVMWMSMLTSLALSLKVLTFISFRNKTMWVSHVLICMWVLI